MSELSCGGQCSKGGGVDGGTDEGPPQAAPGFPPSAIRMQTDQVDARLQHSRQETIYTAHAASGAKKKSENKRHVKSIL